MKSFRWYKGSAALHGYSTFHRRTAKGNALTSLSMPDPKMKAALLTILKASLTEGFLVVPATPCWCHQVARMVCRAGTENPHAVPAQHGFGHQTVASLLVATVDSPLLAPTPIILDSFCFVRLITRPIHRVFKCSGNGYMHVDALACSLFFVWRSIQFHRRFQIEY